jgi:hypothetical protein
MHTVKDIEHHIEDAYELLGYMRLSHKHWSFAQHTQYRNTWLFDLAH